MKTAALCLALTGSAFALAGGSIASDVPKATSGDVCLEVSHIDHTVVVDGRTILFYMNNRKIWKNTLRSECPSLKFERAFSEEIRGGEICSNRQMMRVLRTGTWCSLGAFSEYQPPNKSAAE